MKTKTARRFINRNGWTMAKFKVNNAKIPNNSFTKRWNKAMSILEKGSK